MSLDIDALRVQSGRAVLDRRAEAARYFEAARRDGKKQEARQWEAAVRKLDEIIARYGLERYAQRP